MNEKSQENLKDVLFKKRHSLAHILMMATEKVFPGSLATIGPVIDNGFYYDIDFSNCEKKFEEKDLKDLQKEMKKIISSNLDFIHEEISELDARKYFTEVKNNKYKLELIDMALAGDNPNLTIYKTGNEKFF
jgi:threonyl-tRNA synthetase